MGGRIANAIISLLSTSAKFRNDHSEPPAVPDRGDETRFGSARDDERARLPSTFKPFDPSRLRLDGSYGQWDIVSHRGTDFLSSTLACCGRGGLTHLLGGGPAEPLSLHLYW